MVKQRINYLGRGISTLAVAGVILGSVAGIYKIGSLVLDNYANERSTRVEELDNQRERFLRGEFTPEASDLSYREKMKLIDTQLK